MDTFTNRREVIIGVILALIVGLLIGYGFGRQMGGAGEMAVSNETTSTSTVATSTTKVSGLLGSPTKPVNGTVAEGNSVTVADQAAGMNVNVKSATLSQEGWLAVRNSTGSTLGAALFPAGTNADVSVPLLSPTQAGQSYQVLIYLDDGTKTFNLRSETIVLNPDGSVAGTTFNAQ